MSEEKNNQQSPSGDDPKKRSNKPFNFYWIYVVIGVVLISLNLFTWDSRTTEINPKEFEQMVKDGQVEKVLIYNEEEAEVFLSSESLQNSEHSERINDPLITGSKQQGPHYHFNIGPPETFQQRLNTLQDDHQFAVVHKTRSEWGKELLQWVIFIGIMVAIWVFVMKRLGGGSSAGGQLFNIGRSKAKLFEKGENTNVQFNDVAGLDEAKEEVKEIVDFLKHPKKYTDLGAKIPKGALVVGQPGTGKTLLAKAVAGEAQVPFFSISGSDFVEMFVGVGASRVRDLFRQAREKAPAIVFIDEIDAIGRARGRSQSMGGNDERENTLNQLLSEMDGFDPSSGVIIMAASNRAEILDKALLRPGRFDRQIYVDMPDLNERQQIFNVHLKPMKVDPSVDVDLLARQTPGFSGADIANICNEAALIAARHDKKLIDKDDFQSAIDRIIAGLEKRNKLISKEEKKTIAYHEAGHATVSWLLEHASPLVKVSVIPRGRSLGAAWYLPEERQLNTTDQLLDEMCAALGGRAAEEVIFNKISTGAMNDLEKVTKQAYAMVTMYGLNKKIGHRSYYDSTGSQEYQFTKPYSDEMAKEIDDEVGKTIEENYERARKILLDNKDKLVQLAERLLKEEVIYKEDLENIFGTPPKNQEAGESSSSPSSQTSGEPSPEKEEQEETLKGSDTVRYSSGEENEH